MAMDEKCNALFVINNIQSFFEISLLQGAWNLSYARLWRDGLEGEELNDGRQFSDNYIQVIAMDAEEAANRGISDMESLERAEPGMAKAVQDFFRLYKVSVIYIQCIAMTQKKTKDYKETKDFCQAGDSNDGIFGWEER